MPTLALVVIALNEERGLPLALASAAPFADEILVAVDSRTRDRTREVAADARVVDLVFRDFARMRNEAVALAQSEWVFMLDADELLEGDPRPLMERRPAIWEFPRRHWLDFERTRPAPDDRSYPDRQARMFPNDGRVRFERPVHEVAEGLKKRRCTTVVIHHLKLALRSEETLAGRRRLYKELVEQGRRAGHRFRRGKDFV